MEEVAEGLVKGVFKFIKWFFMQMLIEFIFYGVGRITLLIFTFGKYPRGEKAYEDESTITIVGVCVCIILFILAFVFNYKF